MWDFSLSAALSAMGRTAPFIVLRMIVYFGIALAYILATGMGAGIGYGVTAFGDNPGAGAGWGAFIGFAGASGVLYWAREYILYLVKAGHIAVLVHVYEGQPLPEGRGQINYASKAVKERFAEASILFGLDQLIKGVLAVITGVINTIAAFLPIPGLANLIRIINSILRMSLTYVDEIIIAHNFRVRSENPWETSRQALVLYAQNYGRFVKNAIWLWLMMWALAFVIFLLILGPMLAVLSIFPGDLGVFGFVIALIFAWSFKAALLEPLAIYALMQVYFKTIEGQVPDPEWDTRLERASGHFRKLKDRAAQVFPGAKPAEGTATAPAATGGG